MEHVVLRLATGLTVLPSTISAVPSSPTTYVIAPTRTDARSSCCTPLSSGCQWPSNRRITPSSPAAIASVADVAAMVRRVTCVPVSYGFQPTVPPTFSRRYDTPVAPTIHAEPPAKPTTPYRSSSIPPAYWSHPAKVCRCTLPSEPTTSAPSGITETAYALNDPMSSARMVLPRSSMVTTRPKAPTASTVSGLQAAATSERRVASMSSQRCSWRSKRPIPPPSETTHTASSVAHPAESGCLNTNGPVSGSAVAVGTGVGVAGGGVGVPRVTTPKAAPAPTARTSMIAAAARAVLVRSVPGGISPSPRVSLCAPRSADGCRRGGQRTPERPLTGSRYRGTRSPCWPPRAAPCLPQSFAGPTRGPAGNG